MGKSELVNYNNIIIGIIIATAMYLCLIIYKTHKVTNNQKLKLLQSHLDKELIGKLLAIVSQNNSSSLDSALQILKNYYQFCSVIIYDTHGNNVVYGIEHLSIVDYISRHRQKILGTLLTNNIAYCTLDNKDAYILKIEDTKFLPRYLFVFTKNHNLSLSSEDFSLISTVVVKLLRVALR